MCRDVGATPFIVNKIGCAGNNGLDQTDVGGKEEDDDDYPHDVEHAVGHSGPPGGKGAAEGGKLGRDRRANIFPQDQGASRLQRYGAGSGKGYGDAEHRGTALDDHGHQTSDGDASEKARQRTRIKEEHQVPEALGVP